MLNYKLLFLTGLIFFLLAVFLFLFTDLDQKLSNILLSDHDSTFIYWNKLISKSGSFAIVLPLSLLFIVWLWICQSHQDAVWMFTVLISARLVFLLMKNIIVRTRPTFPFTHIHATTASFPSGHAVNGLMFVLILLFFLQNYRSVYWISLIWVVLVGWSRLALGAHWLSDILAGWGCAMMWFAFMMGVRNTVFIQKLFDFIL